MKPIEIIVIVFCIAVVIGVIASRIVARKKNKKSACGCCSCDSCPYSSSCKK